MSRRETYLWITGISDVKDVEERDTNVLLVE
jgi:hypothetical protein